MARSTAFVTLQALHHSLCPIFGLDELEILAHVFASFRVASSLEDHVIICEALALELVHAANRLSPLAN